MIPPINELLLKNDNRGFLINKVPNNEDEKLTLKTHLGLRRYLEDEILNTLGVTYVTEEERLIELESADAQYSQMRTLLHYVGEVEATSSCILQDMHIRRPVITYPKHESLTPRADFIIEIDRYQNGLYHTFPHTGTDYEVSENADMSYPLFKVHNSTSLRSITTTGLPGLDTYYIRVRYRSGKIRSRWSEIVETEAGSTRILSVSARPMALFCSRDVTVSAKLLHGTGDGHILRWEQVNIGTNIPVTWNSGQTGSLIANYTSYDFKDVYLRLFVDEGTPYEQLVNLYVYRGGIEFPGAVSSGYLSHIRKRDYPEMNVFKTQETGVPSREQSNQHLFATWNWHEKETYVILQKYDYPTGIWTDIYNEEPTKDKHTAISVGAYRFFIPAKGSIASYGGPLMKVTETGDYHISAEAGSMSISFSVYSGLTVKKNENKEQVYQELLAIISPSFTAKDNFFINLRSRLEKELSTKGTSLSPSITRVAGFTIFHSENTNIG